MYLEDKNISIVGAGLVGSLLAIYLSKQGARVSIYEARNDMRLDPESAGRSINLALSDRGRKALKTVGVEDEIMSIAMPMYKRIIHSITGDLTEQPYGKENQAIYSVSRKELNVILMNLAEENRVEINFKQKCVDVDFDNTTLNFNDSISVQSDFIFGADGAGSVVRNKMKKQYNVHSSEEFIDCGYKELTIPSDSNSQHKLNNSALHIWPRTSYMIIALPNLDGTFTCTLFFPMKGENSFEVLDSKVDLIQFFDKNFPDLINLIPNLSEQYFQNPLSSLGVVKCSSWKKKNTILIGDACHATVPFYGQGMNAGFEDCFLLNQLINNNNTLIDFKNQMEPFLSKRKIDTDSMQNLSMDNFIVMRDKTTDLKFILQKKIELWFSEKHPDKWIPLYSMVTFSEIGYNKAFEIGKKQDQIMKQVMKMNNLNLILNSKEIEERILSLI